MKPSRLLDDAGLATVRAAVRGAEARTHGEIVVCVAARSGRYDRGEDLFGVVTGLGAMAALWGWRQGVDTAGWAPSVSLGLLPLLGAFLVGLFAGVALAHAAPVLATLASSRRELREEVEEAADRVFVRVGAGATAGHTGVLVYVSLLERMVRVVADQGIAEKVPASAWDAVRDAALDGLRDGDAAAGLARAVERAGEILAEHAPRTGEDRDELADRVWLVD